MAQKVHWLQREDLTCSICLELQKDPVTTSCGHRYCMACIKNHWDGEDHKNSYSCPQCRKKFTLRPDLMKTTILADLVEKINKTDEVSAAAERAERQRELEGSRQTIQQRIQDREKDVKLLQQQAEAINRSANEAVEDSKKTFTELICLLEQHYRTEQNNEVSRFKELQEKLEQEITELKRRDAELKKLSDIEDHTQFLHKYASLSPLSQSTSSIHIHPLSCFEDMTAAVSHLVNKLQDFLREKRTEDPLRGTEVDALLPQPEPEPKTRAEFLKYSRKITLDPNTANSRLFLSKRNSKVTQRSKRQSYSSHPDRFTGWPQVLSRESLTGRCYWEVEKRGGGLYVAVAYKNISRAGRSMESGFGRNDKSWALGYNRNKCMFWFNKVQTRVSRSHSSRVGVYLDHGAGILSFYSVSETMTLLHRVQTTFTQPLYAGLRFYHLAESSAEL